MLYKLPGEAKSASVVATSTESLNTTVNLVASSEIENLVPTKFEGFVEWGHFSTLTKIINLVCSILCLLLVCLVMVRL